MGNICPANKGESGGTGGNPYKSASGSHHRQREVNVHHTYKSGASQKLIHHETTINNTNQATYPMLGAPNTTNTLLTNNNNNNNSNTNSVILTSLQHNSSNSNGASQSQNGFNNGSKLLNGATNGGVGGGLVVSNGLVVNSGLLEKPNYIALFDYESATKDDMTIKKNDQLIVMDKSHPDWWLARNLRTKDTGYVPFNYITSIDDLQIKE